MHGAARQIRAGMQEQHAGRMNRQRSCHRAHDSDVIHASRNVRKEAADWHATLTILPERPRALEPLAVLVGGRVL